MSPVGTFNRTAAWALHDQFDAPSDDLVGLLARAELSKAMSVSPPPPYAAYESAARVNWRSSWDDDATGVWIRGGHELDQHDHDDRGHVNFVARGTPILIEVGCPSYDDPELGRLFSSGVGHNVLQLGTAMPPTPEPGTRLPPVPGWQRTNPRGPVTAVPIAVHARHAGGGRASMDAAA